MRKKIKTLRLGNGTVIRHHFTLVLPLTEMQLVSYMGTCGEYEKGCVVCDTWAAWRKTGCMTIEADHDLMFKRLMNGEV
jgi:hypothetical protein